MGVSLSPHKPPPPSAASPTNFAVLDSPENEDSKQVTWSYYFYQGKYGNDDSTILFKTRINQDYAPFESPNKDFMYILDANQPAVFGISGRNPDGTTCKEEIEFVPECDDN